MPSEPHRRCNKEHAGTCRWGMIRESLQPAPAPGDRETLRGRDGALCAGQTRSLEAPEAAVTTVKVSSDALRSI